MMQEPKKFTVLDLKGSPREMGRQHGESCRSRIAELAEVRMRCALRFAAENQHAVTEGEVLGAAAKALPVQESALPDVHAEFMGIAEGADVKPERLMVANALTDLRDLITFGAGSDALGCTAFLIPASRTAVGGPLVGQSWDMHASAEPFVIAVHREPAEGCATLSVTTTGCLSLIGMNEEGIAIGNNNLVANDARPAVMYLALIHHALGQRTFGDALAALSQPPRMSGHNYYVASAEELADMEVSGTSAHLLQAIDEPYVHTNHYLHLPLTRFQAVAPTASSLARYHRMGQLLAEHGGDFTPGVLHGFLSDRNEQVNDCCICMLGDEDAGRTCAVVVMSPATGEIFAHVGPAVKGSELERLSI